MMFVRDMGRGRGRAIFANRTILRGEVVLDAKPYVSVPSSTTSTCMECWQYVSDNNCTLKCKKCHQAVFCSDACAEKGSTRHALECAALKKLCCSSVVKDKGSRQMMHLALRAMLGVTALKFSAVHIDSRRRLSDENMIASTGPTPLMGPSTCSQIENNVMIDIGTAGAVNDRESVDRKNGKCLIEGIVSGQKGMESVEALEDNRMAFSTQQINQLTTAAKVLLKCAPSLSGEWSIRRVVSLLCKQECNVHGVWGGPDIGWRGVCTCIGMALIPEASYFNHSCTPTLVAIRSAARMKMRSDSLHNPVEVSDIDFCKINCQGTSSSADLSYVALHTIQAGEELTISYVSCKQTTEERQKALESYMFKCTCAACAGKARTHVMRNFLNRYACSKSTCPGLLVPFCGKDDSICAICGLR
ncbi:hypothetical protein SARC_00510 [Sphaeroforma arctica JP610]|uniref:SET domain-containing protein n=1 Tax=Sphaeroforma arctica JP610 TaxID=667725 RepID=A0A0L0GEQ7_9EUKA|nr:hypothetical protein SARC_00510 [Sphaeroforma arctica JP610]KNC87369.1 hypothetical protein SARC_00510 [Sphaeroforma arctica JP610]|eukprot:XP_014161271.1 hypothetical protein SARC_00510 [Sphaeroforma arctica JP610]